MPKLTILIPLDGSKQAELALSYLTALQPLEDAHVRLLAVAESDNSTSPEEEARRETLTSFYLDDVTERAQANYDLPIDSVRRTGKPYEQILEEARREEVNLLLMTTHGHTITHPERLGGVVDKVVQGRRLPHAAYRPARVRAAADRADHGTAGRFGTLRRGAAGGAITGREAR